MEKQNSSTCCKPIDKKSKGLFQGIIYGIIPHSGCIAFVLFSIMGATFAASLFKPLLAKSSFFYAMIFLSFVFATISAAFYLKKNGGIKSYKSHKGYLSILYGTTITISLIMYFIVFPMVAGVSASTGNIDTPNNSLITLQVNIPCEGHASLITEELKKVNGVEAIKFTSPNLFQVSYNPRLTNKQTILLSKIFIEYPAKEIK